MSDQAKAPETDEEAARKAANILVYTDEFLNRPKFPDAREKSAALVGFLAGVKHGESKAQQGIAELENSIVNLDQKLGMELTDERRQHTEACIAWGNDKHELSQRLTAERAHSDRLAEALERIEECCRRKGFIVEPGALAQEALAAHKLRRESAGKG